MNGKTSLVFSERCFGIALHPHASMWGCAVESGIGSDVFLAKCPVGDKICLNAVIPRTVALVIERPCSQTLQNARFPQRNPQYCNQQAPCIAVTGPPTNHNSATANFVTLARWAPGFNGTPPHYNCRKTATVVYNHRRQTMKCCSDCEI